MFLFFDIIQLRIILVPFQYVVVLMARHMVDILCHKGGTAAFHTLLYVTVENRASVVECDLTDGIVMDNRHTLEIAR